MADLTVTTTIGAEATLKEAAVEEFKACLRGALLRPGDDGYAARTLYNAMIDRRPALIARCTGAADAIVSIQFVRAHNLLIAVRDGGPNVAGNAVCDGGLMLDLSPMRGIRVDPAGRTGRAEPGITWRDFDRETQAFGLATTGGLFSTTGIAGLTLGGGLGWLNGKYGLACDNLRSEATAFPHRTAQYGLLILAVWTDPAETEKHIRWARESWEALLPFSAGRVYVNYLGEEGEDRVREAYGPNYDRLVALKHKYDPTNFFRLNQNIKPMV